MTAAVAYYRVSTVKQGQSGLGLEAQRADVLRHARKEGLELVQEFTEIETGTRKRRRPQLEAALEHARRMKAVLLIAKLDRLARNVAVVATLMESGVHFVAVDMPEADNLTIHVMAAVAQREAELISARTKAALAARKARGLKLGQPQNLTAAARQRGARITQQRAVAAMQPAAAYTAQLRAQGMTLREIAAQLDKNGFKTRLGGRWQPTQVKRLLDRQP